MFDWQESLLWMGKLALTALLGGAIGFERETHGQSAGLRTNVLVAMGSCLMMMVSLHMETLFHGYDVNSVVRVDPGRIASYAVAGMGFLGAGAIIKGKGSIRGLTTAAALWLVTGMGLAVGAGFVLPAIFTTVISLLILYHLRSLKTLFAHDVYTILSLTCSRPQRPLKHVREILADYPGIEIRFINYRHNLVDGSLSYRLRLCGKEHLDWRAMVERLRNDVPGLTEIAWEESDVP